MSRPAMTLILFLAYGADAVLVSIVVERIAGPLAQLAAVIPMMAVGFVLGRRLEQ